MLQDIVWPIAIVVMVLGALIIFRTPLTGLINRARRVGYGDKSIDLGETPAAEQQKRIDKPATETPIPAVPADHALPPQSDVYGPIERQIETALADPPIPESVKKAWLIRALAANRVMREHEVRYRAITGSQINLVLEANSPNVPNLARAQAIYDTAKVAFPEGYTNFPFETWISWPVSVGLLTRVPGPGATDVFLITPIGRDFLHYLVNTGLTTAKAG